MENICLREGSRIAVYEAGFQGRQPECRSTSLQRLWQLPRQATYLRATTREGGTIFHGKRVKTPPQRSNTKSIEQLWKRGGGNINADDRDWKQILPRDLDDLENYDPEHIRSHLSLSHSSRAFVILSGPIAP